MALMFSNVKPIILALTCKFELEVPLNQKKKVSKGYFLINLFLIDEPIHFYFHEFIFQ
jgi:hypothetical protein